MSTGQQIIKILAIIFAIIIIVNIFGWIIFGISTFLGVNIINEGRQKTTNFSKTYTTNITKLKVETAISKLTIRRGEELKVEGTNLPKQFSSKIIGNTLTIKEEGNENIFQNNPNSEIVVTLPDTISLNTLELDMGIGNNVIENINAKNLDLDCGVGNLDITNLTITNRAKIDGGAGKTTIQNSNLNDLDLDTGIGEVNLQVHLTGNNKIDSGVGNLKIDLTKSATEYAITTKTGIGKMTIDHQNCQDNHTYGNGENQILISGGVGQVEIQTAQNL